MINSPASPLQRCSKRSVQQLNSLVKKNWALEKMMSALIQTDQEAPWVCTWLALLFIPLCSWGHWSSDVFVHCIRKQVLSMSHGISSKMITYEEFYTVPNFVHNIANGNLWTRKINNLASTISFGGSHSNMRTISFGGSHSNMRRGKHPAFHLQH